MTFNEFDIEDVFSFSLFFFFGGGHSIKIIVMAKHDDWFWPKILECVWPIKFKHGHNYIVIHSVFAMVEFHMGVFNKEQFVTRQNVNMKRKRLYLLIPIITRM